MTDSGAGLQYVEGEAVRPLVLVGPPSRLLGELHLRNRGDAKLVVRDLWLRGAPPLKSRVKKGAKAAKAAEPAEPEAPRMLEQALRRVVLRPGRARRVPVRIGIDPTTPPGEYSAELQVGDDRHPVELKVIEVVDLRLSPAELVIQAAPGAKVTKQVVMTNAGNVDLEIKNVGAVPLDEELMHCRTQRAVLADVGDQIEGVNDLVAALVRHYKVAVESIPPVRIRNAAVKLAPGECQTVPLTIQLPAKLLARTRYFASVPFYSSTLALTVVATG
jgi:hypothetical protein